MYGQQVWGGDPSLQLGLVRLYLTAQCGAPLGRKEIDTLEQAWCRATRMVTGLVVVHGDLWDKNNFPCVPVEINFLF